MYIANDKRYASMTYNSLGFSGLKVPKIALGLWHNFGDNSNFANAKNMILNAFDNGITYFDLANNYGLPPGSAEINFGKILKENLASYRDEMLIATKAGYTMWDGPYGDFGSRKYLLASLDQSLKRLGLPYVDIFYHHRMDKNTPLEETMLALDQAVKSGKALYAGISNYDSETATAAMKIMTQLKCPFVVNQVRYSMLDRHIEEDNLLKTSAYLGMGLAIFSPLAGGLLTDRYLNGIPDDSRIRTDGRFLKESQITPNLQRGLIKLQNIAKARGQSLANMSLDWILRNDEVSTVIVGASKVSQILSIVGGYHDSHFDQEELEDIDNITNEILAK